MYADHAHVSHSRRKPKRAPRRSLPQLAEDVAKALQDYGGIFLQAIANPFPTLRRTVRSVFSKHAAPPKWHVVCVSICMELWKRVTRACARLLNYCFDAIRFSRLSKDKTDGARSGRKDALHTQNTLTGKKTAPSWKQRIPRGSNTAAATMSGIGSEEARRWVDGTDAVKTQDWREMNASGGSVSNIRLKPDQLVCQNGLDNVTGHPKSNSGGVLDHTHELDLNVSGERNSKQPLEIRSTHYRKPVAVVEESVLDAALADGCGNSPVHAEVTVLAGDRGRADDDLRTEPRFFTQCSRSSNTVARDPSAHFEDEVVEDVPFSKSSDMTGCDASTETDAATSTDTERSNDDGANGFSLNGSDVLIPGSDDHFIPSAITAHDISVSTLPSVTDLHVELPVQADIPGDCQAALDPSDRDLTSPGVIPSGEGPTLSGLISDDVGIDTNAEVYMSAIDTIPMSGGGSSISGSGGVLRSSFWSTALSDSSSDEEVDRNFEGDVNLLQSSNDVAPPPGFSSATGELPPMSLLHGLDNSLLLDCLLTSSGKTSRYLSPPPSEEVSNKSFFGPDIGLSSPPPSSRWDGDFHSQRSGPLGTAFPRTNYSGSDNCSTLSSLLPLEGHPSSNYATVSFTVRCVFLPPSSVATMKVNFLFCASYFIDVFHADCLGAVWSVAYIWSFANEVFTGQP